MPQITIVPLYKDQLRYAQAAASRPEAERAALYQEIVINPHWQSVAEGSEFVELAHRAAQPILQLETLTAAVRDLQTADLDPMLTAAFEQAAVHLPVAHTTVVVMAGDPANTYVRDHMYGIAGYAPGAGKIWLQIDPRGTQWQNWLETTFVHEYHHSAWITHHYRPFDLATYLIFEGRAETFVRTIYPERITPWTQPLSIEEEARLWAEMQPLLTSTHWGVMLKYIFGNRDNVPQWAGYRLGFKLVQQFIEQNPGMTVAEWTAIDAHDMIAATDYV